MGATVSGRRNGNPVLGAAIAGALTLWGVGIERRRRRISAEAEAHGRSADQPQEIPKLGWWEILKRTWARLGDDNSNFLAHSA